MAMKIILLSLALLVGNAIARSDPCVSMPCALRATCHLNEDFGAVCTCIDGLSGDPFEECLDDVCADYPCGINAECASKKSQGDDIAVCTCLNGYIGNPLIACERGECQEDQDCPSNQGCFQSQCRSPCFLLDAHLEKRSVCGEKADCTVDNHTPVCTCGAGLTGNPLEKCVSAQQTTE